MSLTGFSAPWWLLLYVVVAGLAAGYVVVTLGNRRRVLRFANLELLERVAPPSQRWRHLPAALLIASLSLFTLGMAGPTAEQKVPRNRATVMLVIDVSLSMESTDVRPSRIAAAQAAATSFVEGMTPGVNLGLISFAGTATVLVSPTTDRAGVARAI
jgi:Ca-activated chloride channel family protein